MSEAEENPAIPSLFPSTKPTHYKPYKEKIMLLLLVTIAPVTDIL